MHTSGRLVMKFEAIVVSLNSKISGPVFFVIFTYMILSTGEIT